MFLPEPGDQIWHVHGSDGGLQVRLEGPGSSSRGQMVGDPLIVIRCGLERPGPKLAGRGGDGSGPLFETGRLTAWGWGRQLWASREVTVVSGNNLLEEKGKTQRTQQGSLQLRVILASES